MATGAQERFLCLSVVDERPLRSRRPARQGAPFVSTLNLFVVLLRSSPRIAVGWGIAAPAHPEGSVSATWVAALCLACTPPRRRCATRGGGVHTRLSPMPVCRPCGCEGRRVGHASTLGLTPPLVPPRRYRLVSRRSLRGGCCAPTPCGDGAVEGGARRRWRWA